MFTTGPHGREALLTVVLGLTLSALLLVLGEGAALAQPSQAGLRHQPPPRQRRRIRRPWRC